MPNETSAADDNVEEDWLESDEEVLGLFEQNDYDMASKDTKKVQSKMYDEGYRAGIGKGKEAMIQVGFDSGYSEKGAVTGKKYGNLMGTLAAIEQYMQRSNLDHLEEVDSLKRLIRGLQVSNLIEPDWEALEHEQEHGADVSHVQRETEEQKKLRQNRLHQLQIQADEIVRKILSQ